MEPFLICASTYAQWDYDSSELAGQQQNATQWRTHAIISMLLKDYDEESIK